MDENLEIIDLTQSISYCRAPINLSCSVIELDDSIDQVPGAASAPICTEAEPIATVAQPINIETDDVLPPVNVAKKSRVTNKKRKSKTPCDATSPKRQREISPHIMGDCPICHDVLGTSRMAATKCGHVYCLKCIEKCLKFEKKCPTCRKPLRGANAYHPLFV